MDITQKLELIQNIILGQNEKKYKSEVESMMSQKDSDKSISQFNYNNNKLSEFTYINNSKIERDVMHQSYNELTTKN